MTVRPRLARSIPFWILLVGSLATSAFGAWLTLTTLGTMSSALLAGTATPVDVYVGQIWAIVGGILIATGIIGLALVLVLGVLRSFVPVSAVEIVEAVDGTNDVEDTAADTDLDTAAEEAPAAVTDDATDDAAEPADDREKAGVVAEAVPTR